MRRDHAGSAEAPRDAEAQLRLALHFLCAQQPCQHIFQLLGATAGTGSPSSVCLPQPAGARPRLVSLEVTDVLHARGRVGAILREHRTRQSRGVSCAHLRREIQPCHAGTLAPLAFWLGVHIFSFVSWPCCPVDSCYFEFQLVATPSILAILVEVPGLARKGYEK